MKLEVNKLLKREVMMQYIKEIGSKLIRHKSTVHKEEINYSHLKLGGCGFLK